jgi:hypothetical protein
MAITPTLEKYANYGISDNSVESVRQAANNTKEHTAFILRIEVSQNGKVTQYIRET